MPLPQILFTLCTQTITAPPIALNHFYVTVDAKTYTALRDSAWLKEEFGEVVEQTTQSGNDSWSGLYMYGLGSYVEIFCAGKRRREGHSGIGFLTTMPGGVDNAFTRIQSALGNRAERGFRFLDEGGEHKPWFHEASYATPDHSGFSAWVMEYHSEVFRKQGLPVGSSEATSYATYRKKNKIDYRGMMGDLAGVTVRLAGSPRKDFSSMLNSLDFAPGAKNSLVRGPFRVTFADPLEDAPKWTVTEATFTLARKPRREITKRFGPHCRLTLTPSGSASWKFR